jgi:hypothetical protein
MSSRLFILLSVALFAAGCGGGDKHLPSSNPPEYDPKKVYATPAPLLAMPPDKPASLGKDVPDPCEKQPKKPQKPDEPPIVCGGGAGRDGEPIAGGGGGGGRTERPADLTAKHPSYVLEFRSMIMSTSKVDPAQSQASAVIPLVVSGEVSPGGETKYIGQGMIAYQTGPLPNWNACDPLVEGKGTVPMRVFQAFIHVDPPQGGLNLSQGGSAKIELLYGILGMSQETSTGMHYMLNYRCVPNPPDPESFWSTKYVSGRGEVSTIPEQMFLLKEWTYVGRDGVVATKTLRSTCGGMCDQEVATFTLKEGGGSGASPPR